MWLKYYRNDDADITHRDMFLHIMRYYGEEEVEGKKSNWLILKWINYYRRKITNDGDMAWCSIFINYMAKDCGYEHTNSTLARSWLDVGIPTHSPNIGDVVVFWRKQKDSKWGHVGIYIREDDKYIYVLGGNQSNGVNIKPYPKYRLLGYRRLRKLKDLD